MICKLQYNDMKLSDMYLYVQPTLKCIRKEGGLMGGRERNRWDGYVKSM